MDIGGFGGAEVGVVIEGEKEVAVGFGKFADEIGEDAVVADEGDDAEFVIDFDGVHGVTGGDVADGGEVVS